MSVQQGTNVVLDTNPATQIVDEQVDRQVDRQTEQNRAQTEQIVREYVDQLQQSRQSCQVQCRSLLSLMFEHQLTVKMFHLSTSRMSYHKSSDDYLKKWEKRFDKYLECFQGKRGRFVPEPLNVNVPSIDSEFNINNHIDGVISMLTREADNEDEDMKTIIVDMINDLHRFKYFLSFC